MDHNSHYQNYPAPSSEQQHQLQQDQQAYYNYHNQQSPQPQHQHLQQEQYFQQQQTGFTSPPPLQHQNTGFNPNDQVVDTTQDPIQPLPRYSSPPPSSVVPNSKPDHGLNTYPQSQSTNSSQPDRSGNMSPHQLQTQQSLGYTTEQSTGVVTPQPQQVPSLQTGPPMPAPILQHHQSYLAQPVGITDARASMVWKPVVHTEDEFHYSLCGCFKDFFTCKKMNTCCTGFWCPCILYSRIHHRMRSSHPITISETEFSFCNGICCAFICLGCTGMGFAQRNEIRHRYKLRGSCCGDCLRTMCCLSCTLCQEEKELILREKQLEQLVNANRYEVSPGMTMAYVAQEKS